MDETPKKKIQITIAEAAKQAKAAEKQFEKELDLFHNSDNSRKIREIELAFQSETEQMRKTRRKFDYMAESLDEATKEIKKSMERMNKVAFQDLIKQLEVIMPYTRMIAAQYSNDEPLWKYPMHIISFPIQAYIEDNGLQGAEAENIEAQRKQFLKFFDAYIDECREIEKADPKALYSPSIHRVIMKALAEKGLADYLDLQQFSNRQASEAGQLPTNGLAPTTTYATEAQQEQTSVLEALTIASYSFMRQGPMSNELAKINTKASGSVYFNAITGAATAKSGGLVVTIDRFNELTKGLETSTHQLFDLLMRKFTHNGGIDPVIQISLKEYMGMRGLKDPKETREQIKSDLETLRNIHLEYTDKRGGFARAYLFGGEMGIKNSIITFSLSRSFSTILQGKEYAAMPIPDELFKVDSRHYLHAYGLGRALLVHKRINAGKANERRMSIKCLLAACPLLPSYENLNKSKGEIGRKIIEPFEKNLNHLEDRGILEWSYCHGRGDALTADEEERAERGMPYELFSKLYVQFDFKGYPDQTKLLTARRNRAKQAEREKQKTRSQKASEPHKKGGQEAKAGG